MIARRTAKRCSSHLSIMVVILVSFALNCQHIWFLHYWFLAFYPLMKLLSSYNVLNSLCLADTAALNRPGIANLYIVVVLLFFYYRNLLFLKFIEGVLRINSWAWQLMPTESFPCSEDRLMGTLPPTNVCLVHSACAVGQSASLWGLFLDKGRCWT
jgi:hypothetical protein